MLPVLKAFLGIGIAVAGLSAPKRVKAEEVCACLEPPDCSSICRFGGVPKGAGSQACECLAPPGQSLQEVCYTGDYSSLKNRPNRALSDKDGGVASNTVKLNGYSLALSANSSASYAVVFSVSGKKLDKCLITDFNFQHMSCSKTTFSQAANGKYFRCARDEYGRLTNVTWSTV